MKTTIQKNIIKELLNITQKAVGKNINLPILSNVLIEAKNNTIEIRATDLDYAILSRGFSNNEKNGLATCSAKILDNIISSFTEENITIEKTGNFLEIKGKDISLKVKTENENDFPVVPRIKKQENKISVDAPSLCKAVSKVVGFTGINSTKPEITGIFFSIKNGVLKIASTDNFRLAEQKVFFNKKESSDNVSFIVPFKTARSLIDIFSQRIGNLDIMVSENQIEFFYEDKSSQVFQIEIVSRLIDGNFPDYEKMIPSSFSTECVVAKEDFSKKIKLASVFSSSINDVTLFLVPEDKKIKIKSENIDRGEFEGVVPADVSGKEVKISFNNKFLEEGIGVIDADSLFLGFNSEDEPCLIKSEQDPDFIYILMPLKLD